MINKQKPEILNTLNTIMFSVRSIGGDSLSIELDRTSDSIMVGAVNHDKEFVYCLIEPKDLKQLIKYLNYCLIEINERKENAKTK